MKAKNAFYQMATALYLLGCASAPNHTLSQPIKQHDHADQPASGQIVPSPSNSLESKINEARSLIMTLKPRIGIVDENVGPYKKAVKMVYPGMFFDVGVTHDDELRIVYFSDGKFRAWAVQKEETKPSHYQIGQELHDPRIGDRLLEMALKDILFELGNLK
jgi:hypothetical protein